MASSTKIISLCICFIIASLLIVAESHKGPSYGIMEPFLAAGVLTMLLDKNKEHGLGRNAHYQQRQPAVQTYEPQVQVVRGVQDHVLQEYQVPTNGNSPRYETGRYQYIEDDDAEVMTEPRYVRSSNRYSRRGQTYKPQAIVQTYEPTEQDLQSVREVQGHVVEEYQEPNGGSSPNYENAKYQYVQEDEDTVYAEPRYVSSSYTGKAQSYEQYHPEVKFYQPLNKRNAQGLRRTQGHVFQNYREPNRRKRPQYEIEIVEQPYTSVTPTREITRPRYDRTSYSSPRYIRH